MANRRRFWGLLSNAPTVWGFLPSSWQLAVAGAASAMTAWFGYWQGGIFYALIGASMVFAFSMFGIVLWVFLTRSLSVFERLIVESVGPSQAHFHESKDGRNKKYWVIRGLTLECVLRNHSQQTVYFQIKRATHSMLGLTVPPNKPDAKPAISIVPPKSLQKITFATLPDIKVQDDMKGHIDLEILYGPSKDKLHYLLLYESAPMMGAVISKKGQSQITINAPIIKHTHEKVVIIE
jgi:hypothetical protein